MKTWQDFMKYAQPFANREDAEQRYQGAEYLAREANTGQPSPIPGPTPTPTPTPGPAPQKVSTITGFKWTCMFPFDKPGSSSSPQNLTIKDIEAGKDPRTSDYLFLQGIAAIFKTNAGGSHSPNSKYPRTELREMQDDGWTEASWASTGHHSLKFQEAAKHNFVAKPELVIAQIHDANDDVCQIKVEGPKLLFVHNDGNDKIEIDPSYVHGTAFYGELIVENNKIKFIYNGQEKVSVDKSGTGWYFKIGSYAQTNVSKGDAADAFSEVALYSVAVTHQA